MTANLSSSASLIFILLIFTHINQARHTLVLATLASPSYSHSLLFGSPSSRLSFQPTNQPLSSLLVVFVVTDNAWVEQQAKKAALPFAAGHSSDVAATEKLSSRAMKLPTKPTNMLTNHDRHKRAATMPKVTCLHQSRQQRQQQQQQLDCFVLNWLSFTILGSPNQLSVVLLTQHKHKHSQQQK